MAITGKITQNKTLNGEIGVKEQAVDTVNSSINKGGAGGGDHKRLVNRNLPDQHPISAITGLQEILDGKLDSESVLPLIEDAAHNKAVGLFFDIDKKLSDKSYWYLTSEIDPDTGTGTIDSVISGPYNLGAGGGGSGGGTGVTDITLDPAIDPETGTEMWPLYVAVGSACTIGVVWSSSRDGKSTGRGTVYCYVNDKLIETKVTQQGLVTFEVGDWIVSGENKIEIRVADAYSNSKNYIAITSGITLKLASNFEDDVSYTGDITFTYIPTGNIRKEVYFFIDGTQYGDPEIVETSGEQWTKLLPQRLLRHGSHTLEVYFTCELAGEIVKSNVLYYDLICYEAGNATPIIASTFKDSEEQEQYVSFNIRYRVFTPGKNSSTVYLVTDNVSSNPLTIDQKYHLWECRFDVPGTHTLEIKTGRVSKRFNVKVIESTVHVEPVTQSLALELSSFGRSNADPIEQRVKWDYNNIESTLTGFNWTSNGWVLDDDGITTLRVSGDARVNINYQPFATDFTSTGKTFEFEIATSDVKNYEARIFECLDGADTITYSTIFAGEDTRTKRFLVESVDIDKFTSKVLKAQGTYAFVCDGYNWDLDGTMVTPEALFEDYGIKIEEYTLDPVNPDETSHFLPGDRLTVYYTIAGNGFYITPQLAKLQSRQASLSTQYKEGEKVKLAFVVESRTEGTATFKTKLIYMYINGIMSGVARYPEGDSFQQTPPTNITIGNNDATVDVYTIRIYNSALTRRQIVNNWIADTRNPVLKAQRYKHNDNYSDDLKIALDKVKNLGNLPYMILHGESLPNFKKDRKYLEVDYVNPADPDRDFHATQARADVQGTSSQYYYRKNFKIKFEGGFEDSNGNWSEHYKMRGDDSKKEKTFTFKADVASSEGTNNVELCRYFEDTKNWFSPPELLPDEDLGTSDSKKRIRVGIDGFPIVMFHDAGDGKNVFYGKMNFNNDKDNKRTFGFEEGDECWEFINNTTPLVLFHNDDLSTWQDSFECRYPEEYGDDEHAYGTGPGELTKLQQLCTWIASTARLATDTEEEKAAKLAKFKREFDLYFDKTSSLFYYLYTELFLMVDSRAKNAMVCYYKSRTPGDGGNKWFWLPYDMDTALGINNEGLLVFSYDKEDTDLQEGAYIYNGQDSTFWQNLRDAFPDELRRMYVELRSVNSADRVGWSYDKAEKYFDDHQAVWSETIFNEDSFTKYLEPYLNNQDATYLGMAQGSKEQQRKWWMYNRFKYLDSKYKTGDAQGTTVMLRAYARSNFEIKPYINCYLTAVFDQATEGLTITQKATKGITTELIPPANWNPDPNGTGGRDSVVVLYSADLIQDIGDISGFKPGYADFSKAVKLQRLIIGNSSPLYENTNLKGLNIGANHLLTYLDARNCRNLGTGEGTEVTPTIDLAQCYSIEEVYFDGTQIKGVNFPVGGNLKKVHLPETITNLTIRNHPNLEELVLTGTSSITSLWLEDIPSTTIKANWMVSQMPDRSTVRLINLEDTLNSVAEVEAFYLKLNNMHGKDSKGDTVEKAQITGTIHVPYTVNFPYADYIRLSAMYPEVHIDAKVVCTVNFWNENTLHESKITVVGGAVTAPTIPVKASTAQYWYEFVGWDAEFDNVTEDIDVHAIFEPHIQVYTINFDTRSSVIIVNPTSVQAEFGTKISAPVINQATIPEAVIFLGWYNPDGTRFDFNSTIIRGNLTLYAHWKDENEPSVTLTRLSYDTFEYVAVDNVGVIGWTVTNSAVAPSLADPAWQNIDPITLFTGEYKIRRAGEYYFYVKDESGNIASAKIVAATISLTIENNNQPYDSPDGLVHLLVKEHEEDEATFETNFAIIGTSFIANVDLDEHYNGLSLTYDNILLDIGDTFIVHDNIEVIATCYPKSYIVSFDSNGRGTNPENQIVVYKHHALTPDAQIDDIYILSAWTLDEVAWDFDQYVVTKDIELVAIWTDSKDPTVLTLDLEEDETEVTINLWQEHGYAVRINWGESATQQQGMADAGYVTFTHTYGTSGAKTISITKQEGGNFQLGHNVDTPAVMPINLLSDIKFASTIAQTKPGAFKDAIDLREVKLTRFITTIADSMFEGCSNILSFNVEDSTSTGVGNSVLPDSIKVIGDRAFFGCTNLRQLKMPNRLSSIGRDAFFGCTNLTSIEFKSTSLLSSIPDTAFAGCTNLLSINIPPSVTTIGERAFTSCEALHNIVLGPNVINIKAAAFAGCTSLENVVIEASAMDTIGNYVFQNCPQLETVGPITDGIDYNIKFGWIDTVPANIFTSTDFSASWITSVVLPNTITTIGDDAFSHCGRLETINFPYGLETIGARAFYNCVSLQELDLPRSILEIGYNAFNYCRALRTVYLRFPSVITKIEDASNAWFAQTSLEIDLHIPSSIPVEDAAFVYGTYWCYHSDDGETVNFLAFTNDL